MNFILGVKSDPIESRYSFDWLFGIMAEHRVTRLQYGASTAALVADDAYFRGLRRNAEKRGILVSSLFSSIREFAGYASGDARLQAATRRLWERLIHVAALLGAEAAGTNASLTLRDRPDLREQGIRLFLDNAKELMGVARRAGLKALTTEPMSSTWEFPSTPVELERFVAELGSHHARHPKTTVPALFCGDISHGVADANRAVLHDNWTLFEAQIPAMWEFHFKNTDALFNATFGFGEADRGRGIIDLARFKALLEANAGRFPRTDEVVGYLEIPGPKVGRDYTDGHLGAMLGESLAALRAQFPA
jgi:hypothetical protein